MASLFIKSLRKYHAHDTYDDRVDFIYEVAERMKDGK
jgi:hypothetical protein